MLLREGEGDVAAERMAEDGRLPLAERVQQLQDIVREIFHMIDPGFGGVRQPVAPQIRHDEPSRAPELRQRLLPVGGTSAETVQQHDGRVGIPPLPAV
jgi:hypothetical protein